MPLGFLLLGTFVWDLPLGSFRLGSVLGDFVRDPSLGIFHSELLAWDLMLEDFLSGD